MARPAQAPDRSRAKSGAKPAKLLRIAGLPAVSALFSTAPQRVDRLFFDARMRPQVGDFCAELARTRKPYRMVGADELERVAGSVMHGGVVVLAQPKPVPILDLARIADWARDGAPLLLLDGIGNPHNLGAIARTAAFFGLTRLLLADRPDQALPSDAAYRVAEGGLEYVALYRARLPAALYELRPAYRIVGTSLAGGSAEIAPSNDRPVALIFGNEKSGLQKTTL